MNTEKIRILAGILVLIAVGLGIEIYQKNHPKKLPSSQVVASNVSQGSQTPRPSPLMGYSDDELKVLQVPAPNAPKADVDAHDYLASKLAVSTNELNINNCHVNPVVILSSLGTNFDLKNNGSDEITITFEPNNVVTVPSNQNKQVQVNFSYGPGLYGYICKDTDFKGIAGYVF